MGVFLLEVGGIRTGPRGAHVENSHKGVFPLTGTGLLAGGLVRRATDAVLLVVMLTRYPLMYVDLL